MAEAGKQARFLPKRSYNAPPSSVLKRGNCIIHANFIEKKKHDGPRRTYKEEGWGFFFLSFFLSFFIYLFVGDKYYMVCCIEEEQGGGVLYLFRYSDDRRQGRSNQLFFFSVFVYFRSLPYMDEFACKSRDFHLYYCGVSFYFPFAEKPSSCEHHS